MCSARTLAMVLAAWLSAAAILSPLCGQEDDEADHQALRELKAVYEKAASENKLEPLKAYLHEPFSVVTFTNREFRDFESFQARWQKTRDEIVGSGSYTVTLKPEKSEIYGDMAIAHGDSDNVLVTGSGKKYTFSSRWTAVLHKIDGQWKIVRAHSSVDPFGNPMLMDGFKQTLIQVGIAAAVGGLVLGALGMYLVRRRSTAATAARPATP